MAQASGNCRRWVRLHIADAETPGTMSLPCSVSQTVQPEVAGQGVDSKSAPLQSLFEVYDM